MSVDVPRMRMRAVAPTSPEFCMKTMSGTRPSSACSKLVMPGMRISSILSEVIALVFSRVLIVP